MRRSLLAVLTAMVMLPVGSRAQVDARAEARILREASAAEARGDFAAAERSLRGLLDERPGSSGALFALERVLRSSGKVGEILPVADAYLAQSPTASGARYLKLRVMAEVDSLETLEDEARGWIEADPGSADPYREIARVFEDAFGSDRALEILEEGRGALDDPTALAVETGDLLLRLDRPRQAVVEWSRAIGDDGGEVAAILRRLGSLQNPEEVVGTLVEALEDEPTTAARRRAAIRIALEHDLDDRALEVARGTLGSLNDDEARSFLTDVTRRADDAEASRLSLWGYQELRELTGDVREASVLDARIAASALTAGDTATALEAQARLARGLPRGTTERRRVIADLIRVEATVAEPRALQERLDGFQAEFPDAPELDELTSLVASALQARGRHDEAVEILGGVEGPRSSLERAFLLLEVGSFDEGKEALTLALAGITPSEATPLIQMMNLLGRLSPEGQTALARSAVEEHRGDPDAAVETVVAVLASVPRPDQAALLGHGARIAEESGSHQRAAELRRRIVTQHPEAPEAAEATLKLARHLAQQSAGVDEAVQLLESLILASPDASVAPDARRELQRIRGRGER